MASCVFMLVYLDVWMSNLLNQSDWLVIVGVLRSLVAKLFMRLFDANGVSIGNQEEISREVHDICDENSMSRFRYRSEHGRTNVGHLPRHGSRCLSILLGLRSVAACAVSS